ncbi:hypothetical protein HYDPIDRAFT_117380, partial [Hydnomerulius pinastri MD-312]
MPVLSTITETITLLLNTPIVPPPVGGSGSGREVALTEMPRSSHRRRQEAPVLEGVRNNGLDAADVFVLGTASMESRRTSTQSHGSSDRVISEELPNGPSEADVWARPSRNSTGIQVSSL